MKNHQGCTLRNCLSPDRSGKPGEAFVKSFVPDLQRIAGYASKEKSGVTVAPYQNLLNFLNASTELIKRNYCDVRPVI
jgi:hypothetical protein